MGIVNNHTKQLEQKMDSFQLKLPNRPPKSVKTPTNTEAFTDNFIAIQFFFIAPGKHRSRFEIYQDIFD